MSCNECVFWSRRKENGESVYFQEYGECTRFPAHIRTHKWHFCGELILFLRSAWSLKDEREVPRTVIADISLEIEREEKQSESKNAYALRKENKALRELYRKETGKIARINKQIKGSE